MKSFSKNNVSLRNVINFLNNKKNKNILNNKGNKGNKYTWAYLSSFLYYYLIPVIIISIQCILIWQLNKIRQINLDNKMLSLNNSKNAICLDIYRGQNYQNLKFNNYPIQFKNPNFISGNLRTGLEYCDLKLCDFYISSSRKTYLACGNCDGSCSYDSIKYALLKGARLINIDLFDEILFGKKIPIIMNRNSNINNNQYLDLNTTLKIIKSTAWQINETYPLIIYFEFFNRDKDNITLGFGNKDNKETNETINIYNMVANSLKEILGYGNNINNNNKILGRTYGFGGKNNNSKVNLAPIKYLKGKIIFYSNIYPTNSSLDELIHGQVNIPDIKCPEFIVPSSDISQFTYCNTLSDSGGIASISTIGNQIKDYHKVNQTLVVSSDLNCEKHKTWMDKLYNPILADCFSYGIQCVLIYFQYCDSNNKLAFNFFRDSSFIVKDIKLRQIPEILREPPEEQKPSNNYALRNVWSMSGFQDLKI